MVRSRKWRFIHLRRETKECSMSVFGVLTGSSGCRAKQLVPRCNPAIVLALFSPARWSDKPCHFLGKKFSLLAPRTQPFSSPSMRVPGKCQRLEFRCQFQSDGGKEAAPEFLQNLQFLQGWWVTKVR